jgi:tetratricopeptide (TPR) repeat protein
MVKCFFFLCLLLSGWAAPFSYLLQAATDKAAEHSEAGLKLAHAGDLSHAEAELRLAVELAPSDPRYLSNLASILRAEKKPTEALDYYRRALQIDPQNAVIRRNLALALWDAGQLSEAGTVLQAVLNTKPTDRYTTLMLGMLEERQGHHAQAASLLGSVPDLVEHDPESVLALAHSYYQTGQKAQAAQTLALLQGVHTVAAAAMFSAARLAVDSDDPETGKKMALELIRRGDEVGRSYNLLGHIYQREGKLSEAVASFDEAIAHEPRAEGHYLDLIRALAAYNQWRPALEVARKAVEQFPGSESLYESKGLTETVLLLTRDALQSYTRAREINPSSAKANLGLGVAQRAAGMAEEGAATFERGIQQFPGDALHYQEYGLMLLKKAASGDVKAELRAVSLLEKALALDGTLSEAHYELGNVALNHGDMPSARTHLEQAAKLEPDLSKIHYALSRLYRRVNRPAEAATEFEAYQRLKAEEEKSNPGFPAAKLQLK